MPIFVQRFIPGIGDWWDFLSLWWECLFPRNLHGSLSYLLQVSVQISVLRGFPWPPYWKWKTTLFRHSHRHSLIPGCFFYCTSPSEMLHSSFIYIVYCLCHQLNVSPIKRRTVVSFSYLPYSLYSDENLAHMRVKK